MSHPDTDGVSPASGGFNKRVHIVRLRPRPLAYVCGIAYDRGSAYVCGL
jgi:hypothetical protein